MVSATCSESLCGLYNRTLALQAANASYTEAAAQRLDQLRDVDARITRFAAFPDNSTLASETAAAQPRDGSVLARHDADGRWRAQPAYAGGPRAAVGPSVHSTLVPGVSWSTIDFGSPEFATGGVGAGNMRPPFRTFSTNPAADIENVFGVVPSGGTLPQAACPLTGFGADSSYTSLQLAVDTAGGGTVGFTWQEDAAVGDDGTFYINGVLMATLAGTGGSGSSFSSTYPLPGGATLLEWRYTKDGAGSSGTDQICVDDIVFGGGAVPSQDLVAHQVLRAVAVPDGRVLFLVGEQTDVFAGTVHVRLCDQLDCTTSTVLHSVTDANFPVEADVLVTFDTDALDSSDTYRVYLLYDPPAAGSGVHLRTFTYDLATETAATISAPTDINVGSSSLPSVVHAAPGMVLNDAGLPVVFFFTNVPQIALTVHTCDQVACTSTTDRSSGIGLVGTVDCPSGTDFAPNGPGGGAAYRDHQGRPSYVTTTRCTNPSDADTEVLLLARCSNPACSTFVGTIAYTTGHTIAATLTTTGNYRWPYVAVAHRPSSVPVWFTAGNDEVLAMRASFPVTDLSAVAETSVLSNATHSLRVDGAQGVSESLGGGGSGALTFVDAFVSHGGVTHLVVTDLDGKVAVRACATQQWTATEVCGTTAQHSEWVQLPFRVEALREADGLRHGSVRVVPTAADGGYLFLFNCENATDDAFTQVCTLKCFDPYCAGGVAPSSNNQ